MKLSCGILYLYQDKILLCHVTNQKHWDIPKGEIEEGDTPIQCCLRELKEETGLDLSDEINNIEDLGRHPYIQNKKDLHLFKYVSNTPINLDKLKCTTYFNSGTNILPETDEYKFVEYKNIFCYTTFRMGIVLTSII